MFPFVMATENCLLHESFFKIKLDDRGDLMYPFKKNL